MASEILILDSKGKVIISRAYRGDLTQTDCAEKFTRCVINQEEHLVRPVFMEDGVAYCWIKTRNVYLVGVTVRNANIMLIFAFLLRLADVLKTYFKTLEEESIRDNFVITYELLDEVMDAGYPQITEGKVLREYIKNEAYLMLRETTPAGPPSCVTNAVSWRSEGIKHKKNEVFLDVVEKLNLIMGAGGNVIRSEIQGTLNMKSYLSGMPELKLGLNDKLQFESVSNRSSGPAGRSGPPGKAVELEDIRFHQCVRLSKFESDRTISFIPPDGEFQLMSYRLNTTVRPLIWVECTVVSASRSRAEYLVKAVTNFKARSVANDVEIRVPVPADLDSPAFKTSVGHVKYLPDENHIVWYVKQFPGQREYVMSASFGLPSTGEPDAYKVALKRPITVNFEIPYFTVSSITVRYLKIIEKSGYQALPWVRYITRNGDYELRITS